MNPENRWIKMADAIPWEIFEKKYSSCSKGKNGLNMSKKSEICDNHMGKYPVVFLTLRDVNGDDYAKLLMFLSKCLHDHYDRKVNILNNEYHVPLESSYYIGFYDQMVSFIRSLFESALKTTPYLEFAVITGCLRISKESIFTGLNNLEVNSILGENYGEYLGFTPGEVSDMLAYYQPGNKMDIMKKWYDGYI